MSQLQQQKMIEQQNQKNSNSSNSFQNWVNSLYIDPEEEIIQRQTDAGIQNLLRNKEYEKAAETEEEFKRFLQKPEPTPELEQKTELEPDAVLEGEPVPPPPIVTV